MTGKVLLVDDDLNLLNALKRHFRKRFNLSTAESPDDALAHFYLKEPVCVIVVDMRMPGMDGLELLKRIKGISPDTVRIMLTGNADQQTAVDAVNQGRIFRFYSKPCPPDDLAKAIEDGISQYKLVTAEQELLERTLAGSVKVLVDVLSMVDPVSFGRSDKIREWADKVSRHLKLKQPWRLNMAAMLCQLGNITVPPEIMAKMADGTSLTDTEREIVNGAPGAARDLIASIPRLKPVSEIVYLQNMGGDGNCGSGIPLEARILKILVDLEKLTRGTYPSPVAFKSLFERGAEYDTQLLSDIRKCLEKEKSNDDEHEPEEAEVPVSLLLSGYTLVSDLKLDNDHLILAAGNRLSEAHIQKIRGLAKIHKFQEPVMVLCSR